MSWHGCITKELFEINSEIKNTNIIEIYVKSSYLSIDAAVFKKKHTYIF